MKKENLDFAEGEGSIPEGGLSQDRGGKEVTLGDKGSHIGGTMGGHIGGDMGGGVFRGRGDRKSDF